MSKRKRGLNLKEERRRKKRKKHLNYKDWYQSFYDDRTNKNKRSKYQNIQRDEEFINGTIKLKEFIYFCLILISDTFSYTSLQYEIFEKTLPILLPLFYGQVFYNKNKEALHEVLGTTHKKLFLRVKGCRRDGKSIAQASISAGVICICEIEVKEFFIPLLGPSEKTGERLNDNIQMILNLNNVQKRYAEKLYFKKSIRALRVENKGNKRKKVAQVLAPTEKAMRGINSNFDCGDEMEWIPPPLFQKLYIERYKQTIPALWITTPNPEYPYYRKYDKSSSVIESIDNARICEVHLKNLHLFESIQKAMDDCQNLGHVKPHDVPWIDDHLESKWGLYQDKDILAAEGAGAIINSEYSQFSAVIVEEFFKQTAPIPSGGFSRIDIGVDPCDKGSSENAVSIFGYKHGSYQLLYLNMYKVKDEQVVPDEIFKDVLYFEDQCIKRGIFTLDQRQKIKTYLWIESLGHHGNDITKKIIRYGFSGFMRVMKGIGVKSKSRYNWRYCIPKTKLNTEEYVNTLRNVINENRLKISSKFITRNKSGKSYILNKLQKQMNNYIRETSGKLTGKMKNQNDDGLIAVMMVPENINKSLTYKHPFNRQLFDNELFL